MDPSWTLRAGAALALLALHASAARAQDIPLAPEEIRNAWADKKVFARSASGGLTDLFLRRDGTASVSTGTLNDSGTWRLSETGYCTTWRQIRAGRESCFTVVRRGSSVVVLNPDRSLSAEILRVIE